MAAAICGNGLDNDCDGEPEGTTTWYVDCDGDGYAPVDPVSSESCEEPAFGRISCLGDSSRSWTTEAPTESRNDCDYLNPDVNPEATWSTSPYYLYGGTTVDPSFDWNCDGEEEQRWTTIYEGGPCGAPGGPDGPNSCSNAAVGWTATSLPVACGALGHIASMRGSSTEDSVRRTREQDLVDDGVSN